MNDRTSFLRERLQTQLQPLLLDIRDDGAKHIGHAQAGHGHYAVRIVAARSRPRARCNVTAWCTLRSAIGGKPISTRSVLRRGHPTKRFEVFHPRGLSMRIALRSLFLITAIALLAACGGRQNSADTSTVLATVNGVPITNDMFRAYVRSLAGGQEPQLDAQRRQLVLNRLIDMEVLGQEAQKSGLEKQATVAADLKIQRTGLLAQQLVQQYLSQHPVTEDQIKAEYAAKTKAMPGIEYRARTSW